MKLIDQSSYCHKQTIRPTDHPTITTHRSSLPELKNPAISGFFLYIYIFLTDYKSMDFNQAIADYSASIHAGLDEIQIFLTV
jgi:hypothetical protein